MSLETQNRIWLSGDHLKAVVALKINTHLPIANRANLRDLIAATGLVISNWIQIDDFSAHVTVKFDGWPKKTIGHFFCTTSSFVHHFKSIGEFKLEIQSRNAQFGSKLAIFCPLWPWNLMDDLGKQLGTSSIPHQTLCIISKPPVKSNLSYSPETLNLGQNRQFFVLCDVEIWWMTLINNRALFLCSFKLCASFHSHWWIQTGVTVRKRSIWVKIDDFFIRVTLKFDGCPWKQ